MALPVQAMMERLKYLLLVDFRKHSKQIEKFEEHATFSEVNLGGYWRLI